MVTPRASASAGSLSARGKFAPCSHAATMPCVTPIRSASCICVMPAARRSSLILKYLTSLSWFIGYGNIVVKGGVYVLDKTSLKLLKALAKKPLTRAEMAQITGKDDLETHLRFLRNRKLADSGPADPTYDITLEGRSYLENRQRQWLLFILPYAITTFIALLSLGTSLLDHWSTIQSWFQG